MAILSCYLSAWFCYYVLFGWGLLVFVFLLFDFHWLLRFDCCFAIVFVSWLLLLMVNADFVVFNFGIAVFCLGWLWDFGFWNDCGCVGVVLIVCLLFVLFAICLVVCLCCLIACIVNNVCLGLILLWVCIFCWIAWVDVLVYLVFVLAGCLVWLVVWIVQFVTYLVACCFACLLALVAVFVYAFGVVFACVLVGVCIVFICLVLLVCFGLHGFMLLWLAVVGFFGGFFVYSLLLCLDGLLIGCAFVFMFS